MFGVQNQFLQNFMKMRSELNKKPVASEMPKSGRPMPEVPKKGAVVSLRSIIDDKPKQKAVVEFFRNRVEELQAEEE
jgi:hypothetical protein